MRENVKKAMELLKDDFFFTHEKYGVNRMEYDEENGLLLVYSAEDPLYINGAAHIGSICRVLDLCCAVRYNATKERIEFRIH